MEEFKIALGMQYLLQKFDNINFDHFHFLFVLQLETYLTFIFNFQFNLTRQHLHFFPGYETFTSLKLDPHLPKKNFLFASMKTL